MMLALLVSVLCAVILKEFYRKNFVLAGFPAKVVGGLNVLRDGSEEQYKLVAMIPLLLLIVDPSLWVAAFGQETAVVGQWAAIGSALVQMLRKPVAVKNALGMLRRVTGPTYVLATILYARCLPDGASGAAGVLAFLAGSVYRPDNETLVGLVHGAVGLPVPEGPARTRAHGGLLAASLVLNTYLTFCNNIGLFCVGMVSVAMYLGFVLLPRVWALARRVTMHLELVLLPRVWALARGSMGERARRIVRATDFVLVPHAAM